MTRNDIISVLGPVDEAVIADIALTGASLEEKAARGCRKGADEGVGKERSCFCLRERLTTLPKS